MSHSFLGDFISAKLVKGPYLRAFAISLCLNIHAEMLCKSGGAHWFGSLAQVC